MSIRMTRKEAMQWLIRPIVSSTKIGEFKAKELKAYELAVEALSEPKTGEWIEVDCYESEKHSVTSMRCSLCGKYASIVLPHGTRCVYNFCPFCGERMRGEEE